MGDGLDFIQADATGGALDGVNHPENDVQGVGLGLAVFDGHQFAVQSVQAFKTFDEQVVDELQLEGFVSHGHGDRG